MCAHAQAYYMKLHDIPPTRSSWVLTLLSLAECVTYIIASFMGDYLKGRLVYVNVIAAGALSIICIIWPFVDINYSLICVIAIGTYVYIPPVNTWPTAFADIHVSSIFIYTCSNV